MSKRLDPFYLDLETIKVIKEVFGKLFKNRMSGFIVLTEKNFIATNAELMQFEGNALDSNNVIHLTEIKNIDLHEAIRPLLVFSEDDLFAMLNRDKLFKFFGFMEKYIKLMEKETSFTPEEKKELFSYIPVRYRNGDIMLDLSPKTEALLSEIEKRLPSAQKLMYQRNINLVLADDKSLDTYKKTNVNSGDNLKAWIAAGGFNIQDRKITNPVTVEPISGIDNLENILIGMIDGTKKYDILNFLLEYKNQGRKSSKYEVGSCFGHQVLTSMLFLYFSHIKDLHPDGSTNQVTEPITRDVKDLTNSNLYRLVVPKTVNRLFENRDEYSIVIPVIPGINHPLPKYNSSYLLNTIFWKEDQSVRHLYVFNDPEFHVTSFIPHSTAYLLESERKETNE